MDSSHKGVAKEGADLERRAAHLRDAVLQRCQERNDSVSDLARVLDMSVGHWYRIKKEPARLGGLSMARAEALAQYVGWPKVQVMVAIGWLRESEVADMLSPAATVRAAMERLTHSPLANGVVTPLHRAAHDHRVLMARLLIAAESQASAQV